MKRESGSITEVDKDVQYFLHPHDTWQIIWAPSEANIVSVLVGKLDGNYGSLPLPPEEGKDPQTESKSSSETEPAREIPKNNEVIVPQSKPSLPPKEVAAKSTPITKNAKEKKPTSKNTRKANVKKAEKNVKKILK